MGKEVERKFLVTGDGWRGGGPTDGIRQGYITAQVTKSVRVRIAGDRAYLTIKGERAGATRSEYEYAIPRPDAEELLDSLCDGALIEKTRHHVDVDGVHWVIDVFTGDNEGLVVAEVELTDEAQPFTLPSWAGAEVTDDERYLNANLVRHPYCTWRDAPPR